MTPKELYDTGKRFRNFNPEDYEAYTAPNLGVGSNEAGSVVLPDYDTMEIVFEAIAANESPLDAEGVIPPEVDMPSIAVGVYNGTFEEGVALEASEEAPLHRGVHLHVAGHVEEGAPDEADEQRLAEVGLENEQEREDRIEQDRELESRHVFALLTLIEEPGGENGQQDGADQDGDLH